MEYWIEIKDHPRYRVSTMGRVKCVDYRGTGKEKICKLSVGSHGYLQVHIDGVSKLVHRLVLEGFIPRPQNKQCADHISTVKVDCRLENLRWVSHKENSKNPLSLKHMSENNAKTMLGKLGADCPNSVTIIQLTKDGQFIRRWSAAREVERELGINHGDICSCCRGKLKSAGGFRWVYASNYQKHISDINPLF